MLEITRKRAEGKNKSTICQFELNDFLLMDEKEQFDFIIVMGVFDYLSDPLLFLRKLKSVAKEKIVASFPGHAYLREPLRKLRYKLTSKGRVYFYSQKDIVELVEKIGFHHVEIRPMKTGSGFVLIASVSL